MGSSYRAAAVVAAAAAGLLFKLVSTDKAISTEVVVLLHDHTGLVLGGRRPGWVGPAPGHAHRLPRRGGLPTATAEVLVGIVLYICISIRVYN